MATERQWEARLRACQAKVARLEQAGKKPPPAPSPTGRIDKKGAGIAAGGGAACAPAGAYSQEIVDWIYSMVNELPYWLQGLFGLSLIEDLVGALVGFCVGAFVVGTYKIMRSYQ